MGGFPIRWYSVCYLGGFVVVWALLFWRFRRGEFNYSPRLLENIFFACLVGAVLGGRIGYALLYHPEYYSTHFLEVILPWNVETGSWTGFFGMSYHGALIGVLLSGYLFVKRHGLSFFALADFIVPAVGLGYALGRIGNFLNGELYGRQTGSVLGMYVENRLRHPSQIYEAFFEGIVLFAVLWPLRNIMRQKPGTLFFLYIILYGTMRFFVEFFREPDARVFLLGGRMFSLGQLYSLCMVLCAVAGMFFMNKCGILFMRKMKNVSNKHTL